MRVILFVALCLPAFAAAETVTVSAAISLSEVLKEVAEQFERDTGVKVQLNLGSSGQLMTQIRRGAPVDAFISAADKQMDELESVKLVDPASRVVVAANALVMIVPKGSTVERVQFQDIADERFKRVAIGEPESVPAGAYAVQTLERLDLWGIVRPRAVYGTNVRQVLNYVQRGEADAGIVYRTDAISAGDAVRTVAEASADLHTPIRYPAAVVSSSSQKDLARRFLNYLQSESAQAVFARHGFGAAPSPATRPSDSQPVGR